MITLERLSGSNLRTHQRIFQHPMVHDLQWREVGTLLDHLGLLEPEVNGKLKARLNGHIWTASPHALTEVLSPECVMGLRHFLASEPAVAAPRDGGPAQFLVVVSLQGARILEVDHNGGAPGQGLNFIPAVVLRNAHHGRPGSIGHEADELFEQIAAKLARPGEIVVAGSGQGAASAADQFVAWLENHRGEIAKRVVGTFLVDSHHLTEAELYAKGRQFFAALQVPGN